MDFSKWRKIFYIVAIISMLLSIKSRVFAVTPTQYFKQDVSLNTDDVITLNNQFSLTPMVYTLNDNYNLYTIIIKGTYQNSDVFEGYSITIHKGDKLNIKYKSSSSYPTIIFSATNGVNTVPFNVRQDSNLQRTYENRLGEFSTSDFWWSNSNEYSYSWATQDQFSTNFPNNILYSSNSTIEFLNNNNEIIDSVSPFQAPSFDNVTDIENGNPDGVFISPGDLANTDNLYFHLLRIDTGVSSPDNSIYYYSDKTFLLNKDSNYYRTWLDPQIEGFYYYIPQNNLSLSTNTSYLYVLSNSSTQIQNSHGIYSVDISNGIYDVVQSDTTGVITATEEQSNIMKNIEEQNAQNSNTINNINNTLNDTNVSNSTNTDIDSNLNFDNSNILSSAYTDFFSRLTSTISSLSDYNFTDISTINLPIPHSNETIAINSDLVSSHLPSVITNIIYAFWYFIFGKYFIAFILKIYKLITTGDILTYSNTSHEIITNDVL